MNIKVHFLVHLSNQPQVLLFLENWFGYLDTLPGGLKDGTYYSEEGHNDKQWQWQWHNDTMTQWHNDTMTQWHNDTMTQWQQTPPMILYQEARRIALITARRDRHRQSRQVVKASFHWEARKPWTWFNELISGANCRGIGHWGIGVLGVSWGCHGITGRLTSPEHALIVLVIATTSQSWKWGWWDFCGKIDNDANLSTFTLS